MKGSDTTNMTVKLTEALGSVRVLDDPAEHKEWLEEHDGMLTDVGPALTEGLRYAFVVVVLLLSKICLY
jgi:hypothetical protein